MRSAPGRRVPQFAGRRRANTRGCARSAQKQQNKKRTPSERRDAVDGPPAGGASLEPMSQRWGREARQEGVGCPCGNRARPVRNGDRAERSVRN